jgi:hypothetical protein
VEWSPCTDSNQRFANRECRAAVGQADLDDGLDTLGDQQVAEGVAVALGDRDGIEVVGAIASPRRTIVCESTTYVAYPLAVALCAHGACRRSSIAERYIEEGLRMDEHPAIDLRDGAAGRRPAVLGTGSTWPTSSRPFDRTTGRSSGSTGHAWRSLNAPISSRSARRGLSRW